MFALGLLGFISGLVFRKDIRTKTQRALLCLYGALSTFFIYGGIMDSAYVLMAGSEPTLAALLAAYASGLPFNLIFAGATVVFLLVLTRRYSINCAESRKNTDCSRAERFTHCLLKKQKNHPLC